MVFDINTGRISLEATGDNAFIVRKGKKIKIPSVEVRTKLISDLQKTGNENRKELDEFEKDYPSLKDGDSIVCGSKSTVRLSNDYNKGKTKPLDDWKENVSKTINMGPNSEMFVSGFESWDETEDKKRNHGESVQNIELKKGLFLVSYSNTDEILRTPMAEIKFLGNGGNGGTFDVYENILYSNAGGEKGVEYTNLKTKKKYLAKSTVPQETIVTGDGIYKKGILKMDDLFSSMNSIGINSYFQGVMYKALPEMDENKIAESYKNLPKTMEQAVGAFEMYSQMSPEDMERMLKIGEKHGAQITPEVREQMKGLPDAMKEMQKAGYMDQMKKAMAMGKGMVEGLGGEGVDRLIKFQSKGFKKAKESQDQLSKMYTADGKQSNISEIFESQRKYKSLADAKKVA